jgi:O-antigen/teichoic acid export membrane protein
LSLFTSRKSIDFFLEHWSAPQVTTTKQNTAERHLLGWIGWAGFDAIGRLALLTGSTVVFSRLLTPRDFGVTELALTVVAVASVFVGMPFEEALTQRRGLRMIHLRAALGASWLIGLVIFVVSIFGGWLLAAFYGQSEMRYLLPIAMISIFFSGHSDIATALARRLRRFNDVAYATLVGHVVGIGLSLLLALLGAGVWSLIAQRLLVVVARAVILQYRIGFLILPRWSPSHIGQLGRFAGLSFLSRLSDNLTYLAFNNIVEIYFGMTVLGYVNMAMRLIEPIRGAIGATGHNLAFSFFASASRDHARLAKLAEAVVSRSAFAIVPVFVGMAAVAPVLLPLVAGPGWDDAIDITICFAIAGAIAVPSGLIFTALSANARPEFGLLSTLAGFAATLVVLIGASALGPLSVGLSRIAGDATRAAFAIGLSSRALSWSRGSRLAALAPAWMLGAIMGLVVAQLGALLPVVNRLPNLVVMIMLGVGVYAVLLGVFARPALRNFIAMLRAHRRHDAAEAPSGGAKTCAIISS